MIDNAHDDFLPSVRALAAGGVEISSFDPYPSAELIGELARSIVDIAHDRRYIAKGRVEEYRERAAALHIAGVRATARYQGGHTILSALRADKLPADLADKYPADWFDFMRFPNRSVYEKERVRLAEEFVKLEDELFADASRNPGRPPGNKRLDRTDYDIIFKALDAGGRTELEGADGRAVYERTIAAAIEWLPTRGGAPGDHRRTHKKRLDRKRKKLVRVFSDLRATEQDRKQE